MNFISLKQQKTSVVAAGPFRPLLQSNMLIALQIETLINYSGIIDENIRNKEVFFFFLLIWSNGCFCSEQQLVDCDTTSNGCRGGDPLDAYKWFINSNQGAVDTADSYPYVTITII